VVQTALARIDLHPGETCLVIGAGSLGLLACLAIAALDAHAVVVDVRPERAARAATLGARPLLDGEPPFTHVLETTGHPSVLDGYLDRLAGQARIALVGLSAADLGLDYRTIVRRQLLITGSLIYDHPGGFARAVDSISRGDVRPARAIDARYTFDRTPDAFARAREAGGKSVIIVADHQP